MSYDYWLKKEKEIKFAQGMLIHEDFTEELHNVYSRQLEIIEEVLSDLEPQLSDEQYEGTVSWNYEDELNNLAQKRETLEPIIEEHIEKQQHERLLKSLGMTQEQYETHLKEEEAIERQRRLARIRKNRN